MTESAHGSISEPHRNPSRSPRQAPRRRYRSPAAPPSAHPRPRRPVWLPDPRVPTEPRHCRRPRIGAHVRATPEDAADARRAPRPTTHWSPSTTGPSRTDPSSIVHSSPISTGGRISTPRPSNVRAPIHTPGCTSRAVRSTDTTPASGIEAAAAVLGQTAYVVPVPGRRVGMEDEVVAQQLRQDHGAEIVELGRGDPLEDLRLEHVHATVAEVRPRLLRARLLLKAGHSLFVVDHDHTVLGGVVDLRHRQGGDASVRTVSRDQGREIDIGEGVAAQDQEGIVAEETLVVLDPTGRAQQPLLERVGAGRRPATRRHRSSWSQCRGDGAD